MAQQQQQQYPPPPRTYSPLPRTDSPHQAPQHGPPGPYAPPVKRQASSPNPHQSPYGSPGLQNIQLPSMVYSTPHYGSQSNGHPSYPSPYGSSAQYGSTAAATSNPSRPPTNHTTPAYTQSFPPYSPNSIYGGSHNVNGFTNYNTLNAPQQQPPRSQTSPVGGMGPPARPVDKPTDINDLGDVMAGSGVDLREEEAALLSSFTKAGQQRHNTGYGPNSTGNYGPSYQYPKTNLYGQNLPGERDTFYGGGTFNQQPAPAQSAEEIAAESQKRALRRKAEISSHHMNRPFLDGGSVRRRLARQAAGMQVTVPQAGVLTSQPGHAPRQIALQGPDRNEVIRLVQGEDLLQLDATLGDLLALISLAAEERMRNLVEDAATLAKGRKIGSHGIVPDDLADLVNDTVTSEAVSGLPTPGNSAASPSHNPLKRSYSEINQPLTPISPNGRKFSVQPGNPVAEALQSISKTERAQEEERLKKRQRREASKSGSGTPGASGTIGEVAPDIEKKGGKAKEKLDASTKKMLETQQHATTTKTMNMALGIGKQKSWMMKGSSTGHVNTFLQKPSTAAQPSKTGTPSVNGVVSTLPKNRIFGELREDKEAGAGIQLRDLVAVLENDGKEKRALQRAYGRLGVQKR